MFDDQFTAVGPPNPNSGLPDSGFSTGENQLGEPAPFQFGVHVHALRFGVMGHTAEGEGVAGVYGHGDFGVLGTAFGERSIAVLGASVTDTNQLMNPQDPQPTEDELHFGSGEGVVGRSGSGTGVRGRSTSGSGVYGQSEQANGVHGEGNSGSGVYGHSVSGIGVAGFSENGPGGEFESTTRGQIRLVTRSVEFGAGESGEYPKLPRSGESGEMIAVIQKAPPPPAELVDQECSLWLCVSSSSSLPPIPAFWARVQLGSAISGEG